MARANLSTSVRTFQGENDPSQSTEAGEDASKGVGDGASAHNKDAAPQSDTTPADVTDVPDSPASKPEGAPSNPEK